MKIHNGVFVLIIPLIISCGAPETKGDSEMNDTGSTEDPPGNELTTYDTFKLTTDVSLLTENEREMIPLLIKAAQVMDQLFWYQAYGDPNAIPSQISSSSELKKHFAINYGPWDRLNGDAPIAEGISEKPLGARFYPEDMTKEEFEAFESDDKSDLYTLILRDAQANLISVPYHVQYSKELELAAQLLDSAASICEDTEFKNYLELRSEALLTDEFDASDRAWLDMTNNTLDLIIGPIENYEDQLFGFKTAYESYVLVKDKEWSRRLAKYASMLPALQKGLPVADKYKAEEPGRDAQLNAYDVIYYAGHCNAGSKTIAVNLPNDETIQLEKGTRRSQLKNAMKAKFDRILLPIADVLIAEEQRNHITFDAFFSNTMFHEVAHGLGIKNTLNGKGAVRTSLKEQASALEEGKADILGLYMVTELHEAGELRNAHLEDYYVTFMAGIFRSTRFGASSAHGKANMLRFNFFEEMGAFARDEPTGTYRVDMDKMRTAMNALSTLILTLQGNGDYEGVVQLMEEKGKIGQQLQQDLDRLYDAGIPVDIVFEQGIDVLGL